jgi:hypothetical protein
MSKLHTYKIATAYNLLEQVQDIHGNEMYVSAIVFECDNTITYRCTDEKNDSYYLKPQQIKKQQNG